MNIADLVLIEDDLDAQKMVVCWPRVHRELVARALSERDRERTQLEAYPIVTNEGSTLFDADDIHEAWSRMTGVDIEDVERVAPILFANELVSLDGSVSEDVTKFVTARIAKEIRKGMRS